MSNIFNALLYQPILQILIFIYKTIAFRDLGLAIILLTILIRLVLLPFFYRGAKDQTTIQKLQPLVKKIQQDHKDNKEKQTQALLELYRQHRINPFSSFLLLIIQLPILIALYRVFLTGLSDNAVFENYYFLNLINLIQKNFLIVILATVAQYFQSKLMMPKPESGQAAANKAGQMMLFIGPVLTFVILNNLPSAIGLYWLVSSLFSLGQQVFINKALEKQKQHGENFGENKKTT